MRKHDAGFLSLTHNLEFLHGCLRITLYIVKPGKPYQDRYVWDDRGEFSHGTVDVHSGESCI